VQRRFLPVTDTEGWVPVALVGVEPVIGGVREEPEGIASSTLKSRLQAGNDFDETIISHNRNITGASAAFNEVFSPALTS
jgi:hypothetical protein